MREAADYVVANGPDTGQERWENQSGWSPNTIATEIAGLICAANIARRNGDPARAATYEATADRWQHSVEDWTATDSSPFYQPVPHYLRVTKDANPNDGRSSARRSSPAATPRRIASERIGSRRCWCAPSSPPSWPSRSRLPSP